MQVLILTVLVITVTCSGFNCARFVLFFIFKHLASCYGVEILILILIRFTHRNPKFVIIIMRYFSDTNDCNFHHHLGSIIGRGVFL